MLFWRDSQFAVESVMPDFLHVVPVADNTVLDWSLDFEHTALLLGLFTNIDFFLVETDHNAWHFGSANNSGEY